MGTFVAEAGTDVSVGGGGEKAKNGENDSSVEAKPGTEGEVGWKSPPPMHDGKSPNELPEGQNVDENQDPLKDWGYTPREPDYVHKCNGNPDSQIHENGDGDLPSFSIKRLRRLPLRAASDQHLPSRADPTGIAVDRNDERGETLVADESGGLSQQELSRSVVVPLEGPPNVLEEGAANPVASPVVDNGEIGSREPGLENGKHAIEEAEFRNPGSGVAGTSPGPDLSFGRMIPREQQTGNGLSQETSEDIVAAPEHALNSSNTIIGESGNTLAQSHESCIPALEHSALGHSFEFGSQVDSLSREDVAPGTSDSPSSSAGLGSMSDKENIEVEDSNRGTMAVDDDKVPEVRDLDLAEAAELPSPGIVQILPPVMGSRFESPGETTDEETDSPRSSEGFAYPDSDAMALPYSGQIMYPSRFSSAQASNGPNLLQYSGSMSLRSDSSTTSNRSFAFPILAPPEWNSSPVRMAKAHPRRKNRFDGCCFFRLSRLCHKY